LGLGFAAPHAATTATKNVSNEIRSIWFLYFLPPTRLLSNIDWRVGSGAGSADYAGE
jgi:hypothetical protein